ITFLASACSRIPGSLPGTAKRNASGASGSCGGIFTNRSITSGIVEKKGLASFGPQTTNATHPSLRTTLNASRTAATGSAKNIADNLATATPNVQASNGRSLAEHCLKWMFVTPRRSASARALSSIPATGSVYVTDPVGPTILEIVSDGSPLPPPISSTFWPIPICACSTKPDVNGANISVIRSRYLSQYCAEICHASSVLFCSSRFILVRRKLTPFYFPGSDLQTPRSKLPAPNLAASPLSFRSDPISISGEH